MALELVTWHRSYTVDRDLFKMCVARLLSWIGRVVCAVRGHDFLRHFEKNRMCLKCAACGHETPGWQIEARRPQPARTVPRVEQKRVA